MASASQFGCELGVARASAADRTPERSGAVLAASSVGSSLVFVSGSVINVALASIGRDLGLSASELQWVLNAELLPLASLTLIGGALGDRFGQRQIFLLGIFLFLLASLGCGVATSWATLVAGRLAAGVGEALILPAGLSILGQSFAPERKAHAVGIWSASAAVASAIAPTLAGIALDHGSWRETFLMQVPLAALALVLAAVWTSNARFGAHIKVDFAAGGLSVLGLGALGYSLMTLSDVADRSRAFVFGVAVSVVAFATLVRVERRKGDHAMLPPALFASRTVVALTLFTALLYGAFTATLTLLPFVIINGAHLSALVAGTAFIPLQVLITGVSPWAGALCARFGHSLPLTAGALITGSGCIAALKIGIDATYWSDIFPAVLLVAVGMSLVVAPLTTLVLTSVDRLHAATASGFNGAVSRAGSLFAVALLGDILQRSGEDLVRGFHLAMMACTVACVVAALATFAITAAAEPDPAFGL
ncbi:MAG: hypothetical protein JWR80_1962 [Bradyrhizobium sp.]|nr:hypothetical protein [Bradyrhizobium sp.]